MAELIGHRRSSVSPDINHHCAPEYRSCMCSSGSQHNRGSECWLL